MKIIKAILLTSLIVILSVLYLNLTNNQAAAVSLEKPSIHQAEMQMILETTIQITMLKQVTEEFEIQDGSVQYSDQQTVFTGSRGLGTLISHRGEILLISHDHWSLLTGSTMPDKVEFRNANGSLLLETSGIELLSLIIFHDGGTLILKAPKELAARTSATADIESLENLIPGKIVQVAHQSPDQEGQVSILAAEVVDQEIRNGVPVLRLRNLDGESIVQGDSGGGIWVNGHLVGNLWKTVLEVHVDSRESNPTEHNQTAISLAARLPNNLFDLVETLHNLEIPANMEIEGMSSLEY